MLSFFPFITIPVRNLLLAEINVLCDIIICQIFR